MSKVKEVELILQQTMKAQRGEVEVWLYSFFKLCARCWWLINATLWSLYPRGSLGTLCRVGAQWPVLRERKK